MTPSDPNEDEWLEKLEARTYKTYKARINAASRLRMRGAAWNTALISTSAATTIAGIAQVADLRLYGRGEMVMFAALGVVSLVVSLVVASMNYQSRSRDMFHSYRRIQNLSADVEYSLAHSDSSQVNHKRLADRYQELLDESENHSFVDFAKVDRANVKTNTSNATSSRKSIRDELRFWVHWSGQASLTFLPFVMLLLPLLVLFPVLTWMLAE